VKKYHGFIGLAASSFLLLLVVFYFSQCFLLLLLTVPVFAECVCGFAG
jgi:hypothetical protein